MEIWKPIKNFEGFYEISSYGNARRIKKRGNNNYRFSEDQITEIKRLIQSGVKQNSIAKKLGCNTGQISKINSRACVIKNGGILKLALRKDGYVFITPCVNGITKMLTVHIEVAKAFIGERDNGMQVNHIDGNKLNNHVGNLEYCTPSENSRHAKYALHKNCKLNKEKVIEIRKLISEKISRKAIADTFCVSKSVIDHIATGYSWSYV
jgi:hypothetical protein